MIHRAVRALSLSSAVVVLCLATLAMSVSFTQAAQVYDLKNDWLNGANPNGQWSYRKGNALLPFFLQWSTPNQDAYAEAVPPLSGHIPFVFKLQDHVGGVADMSPGDIGLHSTDAASGSSSQGEGNVAWTSPGSGTISVQSQVYYGGDDVVGRSNDWLLYHNCSLLAQGTVGYNDGFSASSPATFSQSVIHVVQGDVVQLVIAKNSLSPYGMIAGINLHIEYEADPVQPVRYSLINDFVLADQPGNTPWQYRRGNTYLHVQDPWNGPNQPAYAQALAGLAGHIPAIFRVENQAGNLSDLMVGDIAVHSYDGSSGPLQDGSGVGEEANIAWIAPEAGSITIQGGVWWGGDEAPPDRSNQWRLYKQGSLIGSGDVYPGDPYNRLHPFTFCQGVADPSHLRGVPVSPGEEVRLDIVKRFNSPYGMICGVNFTILFSPAARTPQITWSAPPDLTYGLPLGAAQLNAFATDPITGAPVAGTYHYSPAAGTILPVGTAQSLQVLFTPTDTAQYTTATAAVSINITPAPTTLTLSSSANPSLPGQSVTFTASVSAGSASGTITFLDGGNPLGTATVSGGQASFATASLGLGSHIIQAIYSGDANHLGSSETRTQIVKQTTTVIVRLLNSVGAAIEGGRIQYYNGSWLDIGLTGPDGTVTIELNPGSYNFSADYAFTRTTKAQNVGANATVVFQTVHVITHLETSTGAPLAGAKTQYYAGAWRDIGYTGSDGNATIEILPGNYSFAVDYAFARTTKIQNVVANATVGFQTVQVVTHLEDSTGAPLAGAKTQYYSGAWRDIGYTGPDGNASTELLPVTYNFSVDYAFGRTTQVQNVMANATVGFRTFRITSRLENSVGAPLAGAKAQYYAGAWRDIGLTGSDGNVAIELLPGSYNFGLDYAFGRTTKTQGVGANDTVLFQTLLVTTRLESSVGAPLAGAKAQYYAGAWRDIGLTGPSGTVAVELLAGSYNFSVDYAFGRTTKTQNVAASAAVGFQTGKVHSLSGTCVQYYGGAWRTFVNDMELLPITASFKFNDGTANTAYSITAGNTTNIH